MQTALALADFIHLNMGENLVWGLGGAPTLNFISLKSYVKFVIIINFTSTIKFCTLRFCPQDFNYRNLLHNYTILTPPLLEHILYVQNRKWKEKLFHLHKWCIKNHKLYFKATSWIKTSFSFKVLVINGLWVQMMQYWPLAEKALRAFLHLLLSQGPRSLMTRSPLYIFS